jgi:hypothetical protein
MELLLEGCRFGFRIFPVRAYIAVHDSPTANKPPIIQHFEFLRHILTRFD